MKDQATEQGLTAHAPQAEAVEGVMCGGCGATHNDQRCIGCFHDFGTPESAWVRKYTAASHFPPVGSSVSTEPTRAMIEAGEIECRLQHGARRVWAAMVTAALTTSAS